MQSFQYISDIHLEISNRIPIIKRCAPNLILAGDIGSPLQPIYTTFLKMVSDLFDHVFLISGNHEYYNNQNIKMNEMDDKIHAICKNQTNVHYLQNKIFHLDNISIFGGTFWSNITPRQEILIKQMISDYRQIPKFTTQLSNSMHNHAIDELKLALKDFPDRNWIVICHHIPQNRLILDKYKTSPLNNAFASDIPFMDNERIKAVVFGHTHTPSVQGKYYSNPIGYPGENEEVDFLKVFNT